MLRVRLKAKDVQEYLKKEEESNKYGLELVNVWVSDMYDDGIKTVKDLIEAQERAKLPKGQTIRW